MFTLAGVIGAVFLWKAPIGLGVYWGINAVLALLEKRLLTLPFIKNRFLKIPTVEELLSDA